MPGEKRSEWRVDLYHSIRAHRGSVSSPSSTRRVHLVESDRPAFQLVHRERRWESLHGPAAILALASHRTVLPSETNALLVARRWLRSHRAISLRAPAPGAPR